MTGRPDPLGNRQPNHGRRPWIVLALLLLLFLAGAAIVRAETKATPRVVLHRTIPAVLRLPGNPFHPAWPREGQAAVGIEGVASLGTREHQVPIASVAKVMTAYLTLRRHPLAPG